MRNYKKSLAEILAMGYMTNFTGRLGKTLKGKTELELSFPDKSVLKIQPQKINVLVSLPASMSSLKSLADLTEAETEIVYIREATMAEPYWVRGIKGSDDTFTIREFPRTLFALPKYLKKDFPDIETSEKKSKRIFRYFNDKIEQLRVEYSQDLPENQIVFEKI